MKEEEEKKLLELQANCLLNSAACHLKNQRYEEALNDCNEALDIDSENAKALFRKGQALHGNRDYDTSLKTLYSALKLAPTDKSINAEIIAVKGEIQAYRAAEKKAFSKLFSTSHSSTINWLFHYQLIDYSTLLSYQQYEFTH